MFPQFVSRITTSLTWSVSRKAVSRSGIHVIVRSLCLSSALDLTTARSVPLAIHQLNKSIRCRRNFYTSTSHHKKKTVISSEPIKFTSSKANTKSLPEITDRNKYQPLIVCFSMLVFLIYFLYLREENDFDEQLNVHLFERVPGVEEPHLAQAIPRLKEMGHDTTQVEARLKHLRQERLSKEKQVKEAQR